MRGLLIGGSARAVVALTVGVVACSAPASASGEQLPGLEDRDEFPYFATPSGRIACNYGRWIACTTYAGDGGQDVWFVKPRGRSWYEEIEANFPSEDLPRAEYGVSYRYRGIRCRVHDTRGIRCVNRAGHGFRVSIEHQRRF